MTFLDNSGHTFSLESYNAEPVGYQYETQPYIFWFSNDKTSLLSVNNYYFKIINVVIPIEALPLDQSTDNWNDLTYDEYTQTYKNTWDNELEIEVTCESNIYKLISTNEIQGAINNAEDIKDIFWNTFSIESDIDGVSESFKTKLTNEDIILVKTESDLEYEEDGVTKKDTKRYFIMPIYIIGCANEEGTWLTNILIHVKNASGNTYDIIDETYTPITIGGEWREQNEIITINAGNMGINLPEEILKAVYQASFKNDVFNEELYTQKVKEYMLNYMALHGERGNFNSAITSLKWFGYGDRITITKLLQTDNQFLNQYVRDYFNIQGDILESFKKFRNSTMISLGIPENKILDDEEPFNYDNDFWGENTNDLEDLFDKTLEEYVGVNEYITYIKPYYDFCFNELALKISALKFYYKEYFLPIHLSICSGAIEHIDFANKIKFINKTTSNVVEPIMYLTDTNDVSFPDSTDVKYLISQVHYVDDIFNEYEAIDSNLMDYYCINDTCINIPIKFKEKNKLYNCVLLLEKQLITDEYAFEITFNDDITFNPFDSSFKGGLILMDINGNIVASSSLYIAYKEFDSDKWSNYIYGLSSLVSNIENNYSYHNVPIVVESYLINPNTEMEYYKYEYYIVIHSDENGNLTFDDTIDNEYTDAYKLTSNSQLVTICYDDEHYLYVQLPGLDDLDISLMNDYSVECQVDAIKEIQLKIKYQYQEVTRLSYNFKNLKDYIHINYLPTSELIYESHFSVCQTDDLSTYRDFVLYPKLLQKVNLNLKNNHFGEDENIIDINYWLYGSYTLRLLVNGRWYSYDFNIAFPEPKIEFGKLTYKYWLNDNRYLSSFNQLSKMTDNSIEFNTFMWEPELVHKTHSEFFEDLLYYKKIANAKYIDGKYINKDRFYKYFVVNGVEINLTDDLYKQDLNINYELLNFGYDPNTHINLYLLDKMDLLIEENGSNLLIFEDNDSFINLHDVKTELIYVEVMDAYKYSLLGKWYYCPVKDRLHDNYDSFINTYIDTNNIHISNDYLNSVHVFNIYTNYEHTQDNVFNVYTNTALIFGNLTLKGNGKYITFNGKASDNKFIDDSFETTDENVNTFINWDDYNPDLIQYTNTYGVYLDRDIYTGEENGGYTTNMQTKVIETTSLGKNIYSTLENFKQDNRLVSNTPILTVNGNDNDISFTYDGYDVSFSINYYKNVDNSWVSYNPSTLNVKEFVDAITNPNNADHYNYRLEVTFWYNKVIKTLNNKYIVYSESDTEETVLDKNDNIIELRGVIKSENNKYYGSNNGVEFELDVTKDFVYYNKKTQEYLTPTYPTKHWYDIDAEQFVNVPDSIEIYWNDYDTLYIDDSTNETPASDDKLTQDEEYNFKNCFCKYISGEKGEYTLNYESSSNDIKMIAYKQTNGEGEFIKCATKKGDTFTLTENDNAYIVISINANTEFNNETLIPAISKKYIGDYELFKYEPTNDNMSSVDINHKTYYYGDNSSQSVVDLYHEFFYNVPDVIFGNVVSVNDDNITANTVRYSFIKQYLNLDSYLDYDFYLMHDYDYWYGVFISKDTISKARNIKDITVKKKDKTIIFGKYKLEYYKSDRKFLINRMKNTSVNGINHFNTTDIITAKITNNYHLPINNKITSKWLIYPYSIGIDNNAKTESGTDMAIINVPKNNEEYLKGYYNVTVNYSLDSNTVQNYTRFARIRIM